MRRIQLAEEDEDITICQTYITDTYDLFVVINDQRRYTLYMIDLDAANIKEFKGDSYNFSEQFKLHNLFSYSEDQVNYHQLD